MLMIAVEPVTLERLRRASHSNGMTIEDLTSALIGRAMERWAEDAGSADVPLRDPNECEHRLSMLDVAHGWRCFMCCARLEGPSNG